ncbi:pelargonidin 3-O-(6-caffeoylglucoside) 5-O-(6-O-malonylglucoside) 4'''-malonyltransferase-like [Lycium barbarum]|uniref:pelargonidin 3-O-(6-caffeoylglucoside) 5-O-(6-O-malonylglucoside) 4'''-malonyltransferase-like n=1 Tax=Lycium barbarum TaxID=112863 RepID=UPI00293F0B40|nr:pelargonidin 3-O-(6-caffeoylglucoside) 5-O-(6-O-malonylglucoside) 4'''-malonyltransferase-like [Lycium barbarum]
MAIQISHILADGFTLGTFVNEWAHINKTGTTKGCVPSFGQLSSLFPARVLPEPQFSLPSNMSAKIVTRRFMFDALAIAELKDKIDSNSVTVAKSTRMVSVMALIWKVLTSISSAKHGHSRDSTLIVAMNLRGKTKLPSLEHALGNFCAAGFPTRGKPCLGVQTKYHICS